MILKIQGYATTTEDEQERGVTYVLDHVLEIQWRSVTPGEAAREPEAPVHYLAPRDTLDPNELIHVLVLFEPEAREERLERFIALRGCVFLMNEQGDTIERL